MLHWPTHLTSVSEGTMALGQGEHRDGLAWEESERELHRAREILPAGPAVPLRFPHDPALRLLGL